MSPKRKTPEEKIAELEQQEAQLKARILREKARARQQARKLDTRQKVIIGGMVKAHCEIDPAFKSQIDQLLDQHVRRDADRKALGLPLLDADKEAMANEGHGG